jgi:hypothetical protein
MVIVGFLGCGVNPPGDGKILVADYYQKKYNLPVPAEFDGEKHTLALIHVKNIPVQILYIGERFDKQDNEKVFTSYKGPYLTPGDHIILVPRYEQNNFENNFDIVHLTTEKPAYLEGFVTEHYNDNAFVGLGNVSDMFLRRESEFAEKGGANCMDTKFENDKRNCTLPEFTFGDLSVTKWPDVRNMDCSYFNAETGKKLEGKTEIIHSTSMFYRDAEMIVVQTMIDKVTGKPKYPESFKVEPYTLQEFTPFTITPSLEIAYSKYADQEVTKDTKLANFKYVLNQTTKQMTFDIIRVTDNKRVIYSECLQTTRPFDSYSDGGVYTP